MPFPRAPKISFGIAACCRSKLYSSVEVYARAREMNHAGRPRRRCDAVRSTVIQPTGRRPRRQCASSRPTAWRAGTRPGYEMSERRRGQECLRTHRHIANAPPSVSPHRLTVLPRESRGSLAMASLHSLSPVANQNCV